MSWPAWVWPGRDSPYTPVTVPETGVAILPAPHPPADGTGALGAAAGVVGAALGVVVAERLVAASVEVEFGDVCGVVVFGGETVRLGGETVPTGGETLGLGDETVRFGEAAGAAVEDAGPSSAGGAGAAAPPPSR